MTPPPAAHAEHSRTVALRSVANELVAGARGRAIAAPAWSRIRLLVDVVVLYLAATAALFAAPIPRNGTIEWLAAVFPIITIAIMHARQSPDDRLQGSSLETGANVLGVVSLSAMVVLAAGSLLDEARPVGLALRLWLFAFVYLGTARIVLLWVRRQAVANEDLATPALIVGAGIIGERLVKRLTGDPYYGLRPVGFLDADPLPRSNGSTTPALPVLGGLHDLPDALARTRARHVILAFSTQPDHVLVDTVRQCQEVGVSVSMVPRLYELVNDRATLDRVGGLPLVVLSPTNPRGWEFAVKHALDRTFAFIALLVLAPLLALIALLIRLSSSGPILFRQIRIGRDGREFKMFKFRTMVGDPGTEGEADAEWAASIRGESHEVASASPDRTTPIGRILRAASLDELPQLLNVLRGEMSLVGPRPERTRYARDFERLVYGYTDRHRVKSGITGWAQVHGLRGRTSVDDRVEWDNYYIQNWSLRLDLRIIALTIAEILRFRKT